MRPPRLCKRRKVTTLLVFLLLVIWLMMTLTMSRKESPDVRSVHIDELPVAYERFEDRKGIEVVVGHFVVGNNLLGENSSPVSREEMNRNDFKPVPGVGDMGEPVQLSPLETGRMQHFYNVNKFNLMASDRISLNRTLPDVRRKECRTKNYLSKLPSTSVIMVFHNEAWSTLLRTVQSVINRSPRQLLEEIILVDDASERTFLKEELDDYVAKLSISVKVLHLEERVGLIRARLRGAAMASGQVLTFLDAHCECTKGWLTPLLARVAEDRTKVVCPIIDVINDDTFAYVRSFEMHWGAINWELHFRWFAIGEDVLKLRQDDITSPFKTPIMAGGLFAIDKSYFYEIGSYDEQMDIWGGENIEISLRIWQCGGTVEIVPCSHVGHIFRRASPYTFPRPGGISGVLFSNLARVAEVWMDEWKDFFFRLHPEAQKLRWSLNVTDRVALRKRLNCKSFGWYLDKVWPEHFFPKNGSFFGKIRNVHSGECLRRPRAQNGANQATGNALTTSCSQLVNSPVLFIAANQGYIMSDEFVCLDVPDPEMTQPSLFFLACGRLSRQRWRYENQMLVHDQSGFCVDLHAEGSTKLSLVLKPCTGSATQRWIFEKFNWR